MSVVRCAYHFRYGDYQGKKTGRWDGELLGSDPHQAQRSAVYQESQTFARKQAAQAWVRKREAELDQPGAIERANRQGATVKEMIDRYLIEMEKVRPLGKTKLGTLQAVRESYFGKLNDQNITSQQLVEYALWRMGKEGGGVKPQTAGNDLAHLGAVLSIARPAWGYEVDHPRHERCPTGVEEAGVQHAKS